MIDNRVYTYIRVDGESLQNINESTKAIWADAVADKYGTNDIIDISPNSEQKQYLVNETVYHNLIQASEEGTDKDPYGIRNVNFSLISKTDDRWEEYKKQRLERGFDNSELWSLDSTITKFILPRLIVFKEHTYGYPTNTENEEQWQDILSKMIEAFKYLDDEDLGKDSNLPFKDQIDNRQKVIDEGLSLFCKYYSSLWT